MNTISDMLMKEAKELEQVIRDTKERLEKAPKGYLRVRKWKNTVEYYYRENENTGNGKYLKKSEHHIAEKLAQRDYDKKLVEIATKRKKIIAEFLQNYEKIDPKDIYSKTKAYRRPLLHDAVLPDEEYINRWEAEMYKGKAFVQDAPIIVTEKGEQVRSKSEKIIADKLYFLGIPYKYECPLQLAGNITVYPDFTILKMPERREVYLEHFGMLDDESYLENILCKISTYEKSGIYPGVNLFITYETGRKPLNTRVLDGFLRELFFKTGK